MEEPVADLLAAAAEGDSTAWDRIVERFAGLVWSVARGHGLAPADAADVSQTVWLRLVEHLGRIRDAERLPGWLSTTTRNESLRVLRNQQRQVPADDPLEDAGDDGPPVDANLLGQERDALVWAGFGRLPGPCQVLLRLLMADPPPSYQSIAETLGIPIGSIGPTRARCLDRLRSTPEISRITAAARGSLG
jgi:RNA polymerase sigma factor (sigma-70 family)